MGISAVFTDCYCDRNIQYAMNQKSEAETSFADELTESSSAPQFPGRGKRIGVTTIGDKGYIAMYAASSTEEDPVVKVGKYEVHVKDVNPNHATELEMFALLSYMDDQELTDNHGMSTYSKMKAYAGQAEYNGFVSGIGDAYLALSAKRDWIGILRNAKETFLNIPETYRQAVDIDRIVFSLLERR
ncbi:MAG: hypothetical protein J5802_05450 [Butyrivibrio sp.]|nr:hypothetical protein [Butyrivibrio sp.]